MKTSKGLSKKIILLIGVLTASATMFSYGQQLKVIVKNVKGNEGMIRLALYNSDEQFMKKEVSGVEVQTTNAETIAIFKNVPPGKYAISVMHDANNNKELDSNLMGIPKEGFGFSNDAMGMFGPPGFTKASFDVTGEKEITITLRYM